MSTALVWFRQDLRCHDNPALAAACKQHENIILVYIADNSLEEWRGCAQGWWLHSSLAALATSLQHHGLNLCLKQGDALLHLEELITTHGVDSIYWNRCYDERSIKRDTNIKEKLLSRGLGVFSFNGSLLIEPWNILNESKKHYKRFTPFWRHCLAQIQPTPSITISRWPRGILAKSDRLIDWQLPPTTPNWAHNFPLHWEPGELGAQTKLEDFMTHHLSSYDVARDVPMRDATSRLSPHLHFGEISPSQVWRLIEAAKYLPEYNSTAADVFLKQIGWREFSYYLLYHFPALQTKNFYPVFDNFPWRDDVQGLMCWQKGLTGYPLVDAGMRELWQTGYMHNRVRMITASFLVKHLLIDWRLGEAWFMNTLLDADLANNAASWQWVAGSGTDAAPFFRIFNPILQGEKFDPDGEYVKRFVPELAGVSKQWIHKPFQAPQEKLPIVLGKDYPLPIVNHAEARLRALNAYSFIK